MSGVEPVKVGLLIDYIEGTGGSDSMLESIVLSAFRLAEDELREKKMLDRGVELWRHCMKTDRWPGYPAEIVTPEYPGWAEQQWLDREIHEAAVKRLPVADDLIMAG